MISGLGDLTSVQIYVHIGSVLVLPIFQKHADSVTLLFANAVSKTCINCWSASVTGSLHHNLKSNLCYSAIQKITFLSYISFCAMFTSL